jgi:hypothetical protein
MLGEHDLAVLDARLAKSDGTFGRAIGQRRRHLIAAGQRRRKAALSWVNASWPRARRSSPACIGIGAVAA